MLSSHTVRVPGSFSCRHPWNETSTAITADSRMRPANSLYKDVCFIFIGLLYSLLICNQLFRIQNLPRAITGTGFVMLAVNDRLLHQDIFRVILASARNRCGYDTIRFINILNRSKCRIHAGWMQIHQFIPNP